MQNAKFLNKLIVLLMAVRKKEYQLFHRIALSLLISKYKEGIKWIFPFAIKIIGNAAKLIPYPLKFFQMQLNLHYS